MPKYQMYFDTVSGETRYNVDIDDDEVIGEVLDDILYDLRDRGHVLQGEGEPQILWSNVALNLDLPLPEQGVKPNDILRISTVATNG